ncbi:MAG: hypothetical protein DRN78_03265 [Thermoproteota archaeon]|nr:MAG: hypothetical protein DRN78_03265 [Candidatus Korarchaeota archaeon]
MEFTFRQQLASFRLILKIYPTLVIDGTQLYDMWRHSEYKVLPEGVFRWKELAR